MYRMIVIVAAMLVAGCTSLPDVTYRYYGARASTTVEVIRTVVCDRDSKLVEVHKPLVVTTYSADPGKRQELRLASLRGALADSNVTVKWFEDGRLKAVNQESTGQGEAVLKGAIGIAAAASGTPIGGAAPAKRTPECTLLDTLGQGKPITLTYVPEERSVDGKPIGLDFAPVQARLLVPKDAYGWQVHERLKNELQTLYVMRDTVTKMPPLARFDPPRGAGADDVYIRLYETDLVTYAFYALAPGGTPDADVLRAPFARESSIVPTDRHYDLPIPRPALFGKQTFALTLSESGQISDSGYTSTSGAAGVVGVATAAEAATRSRSVADKAAEAQAEADLIAQQQRLARCRFTPASCI